MIMISELVELNELRLSENLTYRELEERTGISYRTLYDLLTRHNPRPYDRTIRRIRRFLDTQPQQNAPVTRRRSGVARS